MEGFHFPDLIPVEFDQVAVMNVVLRQNAIGKINKILLKTINIKFWQDPVRSYLNLVIRSCKEFRTGAMCIF